MFLVGHISIAFLICYFVSLRFPLKGFSLSLAMFLSTLADIDIIVALYASIDHLGHTTLTHSALISLAVGFIFIAKSQNKLSVILYVMAYLSHILIGDIVVGPTNILYPFGNQNVNARVEYTSFSHIMLELSLLLIMSAIISLECFYYKHSLRSIFGFSTIDRLFYPALIFAITISFFFIVLYELDSSSPAPSFLSPFNDDHNLIQIRTILVLITHIAAVFLIAFMWRTSNSSQELLPVGKRF